MLFRSLGKLAATNDPWMRAAVLSSAVAQPVEIFKAVLESSNAPGAELAGALFATAAGSGNEPAWQEMLRLITSSGTAPDRAWAWGGIARRSMPSNARA